jgi:hypothetical protein
LSTSSVEGGPTPDLSVTTPQSLPDPAADNAAILDVAPTVVDEVRQTLPQVNIDDKTVETLLQAVDQLAASTTEISAAVVATRVASELQAAQEAAVAAQAAAVDAAARAWKERLARDVRSLDGYSNGKIPLSALCSPAFNLNVHLRCDAAEMLDALNRAYTAKFGTNLQITDSYRSLEGQIACTAIHGFMCAEPGTSKHGLGLAVDLGGPASRYGTPEHTWLLEHIEAYGWYKPAWSRPDGFKPEAWHFEFSQAP